MSESIYIFFGRLQFVAYRSSFQFPFIDFQFFESSQLFENEFFQFPVFPIIDKILPIGRIDYFRITVLGDIEYSDNFPRTYPIENILPQTFVYT